MKDEKDGDIPLRILHIEDSRSAAWLIRELLIDAGFSMQLDWAINGQEFTTFLQSGRYDLILADYVVPGFDAPTALLLTKSLCPDVPFICVSGAIGDEKAVELMKLGATDYVLKSQLDKLPISMRRALDEVREHKARQLAEETLKTILYRQEAILSAISDIIVEVDSNNIYSWANHAGFEFFGEDVLGKEATFYFEGELDTNVTLQSLFDRNENVFYVESWQRRKDGQKRLLAWWCRILKDNNGNVTGTLSSARDITDRKCAEEKIQLLNIELEKLALTDFLTNLYNRRYFMQRGAEEIKRANRHNQPVALFMLDIDEFKKINDTYGHETGDLALQQVAAALKSGLREIDIIGRLGGDEFAILLPNTSLLGATLVAERIRLSIANMPFQTPGDLVIRTLTISVGVAVFSTEMSGIDDLLGNADAAMYRGKNSGRNCVSVHQIL